MISNYYSYYYHYFIYLSSTILYYSNHVTLSVRRHSSIELWRTHLVWWTNRTCRNLCLPVFTTRHRRYVEEVHLPPLQPQCFHPGAGSPSRVRSVPHFCIQHLPTGELYVLYLPRHSSPLIRKAVYAQRVMATKSKYNWWSNSWRILNHFKVQESDPTDPPHVS